MLLILTCLLATARLAATLTASCNLLQHRNGTIGTATFTSNGNKQRIEVVVKGNPDVVTKGIHALNIRSKAVRGNSCDGTGAIFSKKGISGELGKVSAGERGEINQFTDITIDPSVKGPSMTGLIEPLKNCAPEPYKLYKDGSSEKILDLEKAKKEKDKGKKWFSIVYKEPDCYQPVQNRDKITQNKPMFYLKGKKSIVGRTVVVQTYAKNDDAEASQNPSAIACCTLELVME